MLGPRRQPGGGKAIGAIHIPRIGQEVILAFENGDPDQPVIIGCVYNANCMPPYALPANKTQSGIKTRSSLGGAADDCNELRMEDKKGSEEVFFQAQKDFNRVVKNNDTLKVGSSKADDGSQTTEIWKDRTETIKTGNDTLTVEQGNRAITIKTGDQNLTLEQGNRAITIKMGNDTTQISMGKSSTEAMQSIELTVGSNSIKIDQTGVTIKGIMVSIQGQATLEAKSPMTTVNGDGMLTLKGGITMIN